MGEGRGAYLKEALIQYLGAYAGEGCLLIRAWVHTVFEEIQDAKTKD